MLRSVAAVLACLSWSTVAAEVSLESAPPVAVKTVPMAGATDVDPGLTELRVTFSKAMLDGSWSWSTWGEENFPETTGQPRYLSDGRTCVLPVKLKPGKFYATWLNSDKFRNFTDASGRAAVPYLLTFTTAGDSTASTLPPNEVIAQAIKLISQCPEGDPRVTEALARLRTVPATTLVPGLVPYLDSSQDTIRRSAVYVLWKGGFADIGPATASLQELLTHREDLTRGMAALALGQNRVRGSLEALAKLTKEDASGYARRCAAYALGLLGDARAEPVLKAALNDSEAMVRQNATAALGMLNAAKLSSPSARTSGGGSAGVSDEFIPLLNDDQRAVLAWTDRQFRSFFDARTFDGWSDEERATLEKKLIDSLKGPRSREYYQAINTLAALRSTNALPALREIAYDRRDKDNRDRWMAIRALGVVGDKTDVPELIQLVYHGNVNTRWWAQISLVRITGKNFAKDWNAWGNWWNGQNGQPPYKPEVIRWWNGQPEPDKLAESLDESDKKFLDSIRPGAAASTNEPKATKASASEPFAGCRIASFGGDKSEGQQSYGGSGPAIRFKPAELLSDTSGNKPLTLKGIRLYASRYGTGYSPEETKLHVILRDAADKTLAQTAFAYGKFSYQAGWVDLVFDQPAEIRKPGEALTIAFDPEATQYKGIYFHFQRNPATSHSLAGTVSGGFKELADREWMMRACFE